MRSELRQTSVEDPCNAHDIRATPHSPSLVIAQLPFPS